MNLLKHKTESSKARVFIWLNRAAPTLLQFIKRVKKKTDHIVLNTKRLLRKTITKEKIISDLKRLGLKEGDSVIVHSSLRRVGYVEGGAATVIAALLETIGERGTLLFPTSPVKTFGKEHLEKNAVFDVLNTPSRMGAISEHFRKMKNVIRSFHPLEPVAALGPLAEYYTKDHFGQLTPYNENSPFARLALKHGKILSLGVLNLEHSCINLHVAEDLTENFQPDNYDENIYEVKMKNEQGEIHNMKTKVHNPKWSLKRYPNQLIPLFEKEGVMKRGYVGEAETLIFDASLLTEVMRKAYHEKGISMYFPEGRNIEPEA
ncbi:MAG: AAC(3) family N-acetyltransferase [Bacteroidia bacterium]|nr:AAC(3) family N-acetyltransferase [Bacteroidia bacterium]